MTKILAIMTGGVLGVVSRSLHFIFAQRHCLPIFPCDTPASNLTGCLLIGNFGGIARAFPGLMPDRK
ncbi:MAG: hypothetical protein BM485_14500 [Desulfobulbaceae bacterium DB1]|nr:MAG: hypothetical protein BM485_14500 [Desulfobulbaceae bacterium DB1]